MLKGLLLHSTDISCMSYTFDFHHLDHQLTNDQIREDPQKRPSAATVSASIRNTLPHLACASCVESEVPGLSPRMPHLRPDRSREATRAGATAPPTVSDANSRRTGARAERSSSLQCPRPNLYGLEKLRVSHSHSRHNSTGSRRSESIDYSVASDQLTRHDSRQDSVATSSQTWQIRPGEELDFETTLLSYKIEQGEATHKWKENGIGDGALKLTLYRTKCEQAWEVTRRMVIIDPDGETQTTRIFSNWLPLADLTLCLYDDMVVMS